MDGESLRTWAFRQAINHYPIYFGTGGKVVSIRGDWRSVAIRLKLNFWTRNYVGTIFGGSQYAAMDPFHVILLIRCLGPEFVVWDKAASIRFRRPGKAPAKMEISISEEELEHVRFVARRDGKYEFPKVAEWKTEDGQVVSSIEKTLYVATMAYFKSRRSAPE